MTDKDINNNNEGGVITGANASVSDRCNNNVLIIAVIAVVLVIIFMYFRDQRQQRAFELRCLEKRVELLEEWGLPRQNMQPDNTSSQWPPEGGLKFLRGQR